MAYNHSYNTDDVFIRHVIIAVLNYLGNVVSITNTLSDKENVTIKIPFYLDGTLGDERFYQDFLLYDVLRDCVKIKKSENTAPPIPRGVLSFPRISVRSGELTSRYERILFQEEIDNKLVTYSARGNLLPLEFSFGSLTIAADTITDCGKIWQELLRALFPVRRVTFEFKHMHIPMHIGFDADVSFNFKPERSMMDETEPYTIEFSIGVETLYPLMDMQTVFKNDNRIEEFIIQSNELLDDENN